MPPLWQAEYFSIVNTLSPLSMYLHSHYNRIESRHNYLSDNYIIAVIQNLNPKIQSWDCLRRIDRLLNFCKLRSPVAVGRRKMQL